MDYRVKILPLVSSVSSIDIFNPVSYHIVWPSKT